VLASHVQSPEFNSQHHRSKEIERREEGREGGRERERGGREREIDSFQIR
jgi:hypothetical protein